MKFVGKPEGKLMKGAPGNYIHNEVYMVPFSYSQWSYWELVDKKPELKVPEATDEDSVFEGVTFVEDVEIEVSEDLPEDDSEEGFKDTMPPHLKASLYGDKTQPFFDPSEYDSTDSSEDEVSVSSLEPEVTVEDLEGSTRSQLMSFIESQGVDYKKNWRKSKLLEVAKGLLPNEVQG